MLNLLHIYCERLNTLEFDLTGIVASKQLGPWPLPDITLFSRVHEKELTGAPTWPCFFYTWVVFA